MDFYVALSLDILTVVIVGYCAYTAAHKGFLRTITQLAAYLIIVFIASAVSRTVAPVIYDRFVEPMLHGENMENAAFTSTDISSSKLMAITPDSLLELLPKEIDVEYWIEKGKDNAEEIKDLLFDDLLKTTIRPAAVNAISALCFTVVFCLLSVVANMILSATGVIRHIPVIGRINSFLGALLGMAQGLLLVWLSAMFLRGMLTLGQGTWWIFTEKIVNNTWVFRYFFNPELLQKFL